MMVVAFDFDGTLVRCEPRQSSVLRAVVNAMGRSVDLDAAWGAKRSGASTEQALIETGWTRADAAEAARRWLQIVEDPAWLSLDSLFEDSMATIEAVLRTGRKLLLITARTHREWLIHQVAALGIRDRLDAIHVVSPKQASAEKATLLASSGAVVFIGDTESDAAAAQQAGCEFVGVSTGQRSRKFLESSGITTVADNLSEAWTVGCKVLPVRAQFRPQSEP